MVTFSICAVGDFIYSSPPATAAERRTKVEILFLSSIVKVKLGQKLNSEPEVERRFASQPNSTNAFVVRSWLLPINLSLHRLFNFIFVKRL